MPVIGTAGHVDHGKSSLLERLTGRNPMHLPEEFSRGLTIELGFGYWQSQSGVECGVVDVPGHGHFIRNMAGGAFALDAAIFIVAADDGWKPQTEEHLFILNTAGVEKGIVVLNKADLVSSDRIKELEEELEIRLEGTFLESAPIIAASSVSGAGFAEIESALSSIVESLLEPENSGLPRLWIDRIFKIEGAGSVVTGTLKGGYLNAGDQLAVLPQGEQTRVRKLQVHGREVQACVPNTRVAVNVAGGLKAEFSRGTLLCGANPPALSSEAWIALKKSPSWEPKIKSGGVYLAHIGTQSVGVTLYPSKTPIDPKGEYGAYRAVFENSIPVERGWNILVFSSAKHGVVAGGKIVVPSGVSKRTRDCARFFENFLAAHAELRSYIQLRICAEPSTEDEIFKSSGVSQRVFAASVSELLAKSQLTQVKYGGKAMLINREQYEIVDKHIVEKVAKLRAGNSAVSSLSASQLEPPIKLDIKVLSGIMAQTAAKIEGAEFSAGVIQLKQNEEDDIASDPKAKQILAVFKGDIASFPSLRQLYDRYPKDKRIIARLLEKNLLVKLPDEMLIPPEMLKILETKLGLLLNRKGEISVADAKDAWGVTRKHVIPLLEYFDAQQFTQRRDTVRIKGPKFAK